MMIFYLSDRRYPDSPGKILALIALKWFCLSASVFITSYLLDGIHVSGILSAFFAAAAIALLNLLIRPVLIILTLPITILTFGLFTLVINALILLLASALIPGFWVSGFFSALFGSLIISAVNYILTILLPVYQGRMICEVSTDEEEEINGNSVIELEEHEGRWK